MAGDALLPVVRTRSQAEARLVANLAYPYHYHCCVVCGLQLRTCLQIAHLDHNALNNHASNLAHLCPTHHWMYDAELYPIEVIWFLRHHWQVTRGIPHHGRMVGAGRKAGRTRKLSAAAKAAWDTRRAKAAADLAEALRGRLDQKAPD